MQSLIPILILLCQLWQHASSSRVTVTDEVTCSKPPRDLPEKPIDIGCSVKVAEAFRHRVQPDLRDKHTLDVVLRLRKKGTGDIAQLQISLQKVEAIDVTNGWCRLDYRLPWQKEDYCFLENVHKDDRLSGNSLVVSMLSWLDTYGKHWGCTKVTLTKVTLTDSSSIKELYLLSHASFYYQSFGFKYAPKMDEEEIDSCQAHDELTSQQDRGPVTHQTRCPVGGGINR
ncbi:unnamed protein product [Vitrella brassicaformis CCMP3155]|uniref:Uncharacterized protein n=1 Tax=Vitrella brassicaformis (strain CCMP3155) TaxID=1169540 RepID=A0A0G4EE29_VITBC|nr:unnamed protein product [Vitrella brassicaformis CCMP3155]|eukprot:CEL94232.1 unnamed protein product [Vitrella brassicaformis CCMP3155]